jgi:hypothetical protein
VPRFLFLKDANHMAKKKKKAAPAKRRAAKKNLRDTINVLALIEALEQHVLGEKEMTSTQVSAALALLKKILPDITDPVRKPADDALSHEELLAALA